MFRQKDYPREVLVGDALWSVRFCRTLGSTKHTWTMGLCDPADHTIYIRQGLNAKERLATFCHEIIHAWEYEFGFELPHHLVHQMDAAMEKFITDNYLGAKD